MQSSKEKVSYCIGLETGKNLKQQFADMDEELLLTGFRDAFSGNQPRLPLEEVRAILTALRQQVETQQKEFLTELSAQNRSASEAFLTANKGKTGVVVLPSGLQYEVLATGEGASPKALNVVTAHYRGTFIDGRVFDSSYERGEPAQFPLTRVIPGWSEALQLMKVGDKWKIFLPPYLAYGEVGFGREIGPNMALVFEIELLGIQ